MRHFNYSQFVQGEVESHNYLSLVGSSYPIQSGVSFRGGLVVAQANPIQCFTYIIASAPRPPNYTNHTLRYTLPYTPIVYVQYILHGHACYAAYVGLG